RYYILQNENENGNSSINITEENESYLNQITTTFFNVLENTLREISKIDTINIDNYVEKLEQYLFSIFLPSLYEELSLLIIINSENIENAKYIANSQTIFIIKYVETIVFNKKFNIEKLKILS